MNLVSVIIPIYNVEKYLRRCLDSIVNQTYRNLEIILVDDGSPDDCGSICDKYASTDTRIRVIHKQNGGVSAARNDGLSIASGKYVTFADPDDWCELDSIQRMVELMEEKSADLVYCNTFTSTDTLDSPNTMPLKEGLYDIEQTLLLHLFDGLASGLYRGLFHRSIIETNNIRFDVTIRKAEDWLFYTQYLTRIKKEYILSRPLYHYYQSTGSIIRTYYVETEKGLSKSKYIMETFERYLVESGIPEHLYHDYLSARYMENILRYAINIWDYRNPANWKNKYQSIKLYIREWAPIQKIRFNNKGGVVQRIKIIVVRSQSPFVLSFYALIFNSLKKILMFPSHCGFFTSIHTCLNSIYGFIVV